MAAGAALALGVADAIWASTPTAGDAGLSLLYVLGWALAAWAGLIAVLVVVHLARGLAARRRIAPVDVALVVATALVIVATVLMHPPAGSGGASASHGEASDGSASASIVIARS